MKKLVITLLVISAVVAAALAFVNSLTAPIIDERTQDKKNEAMQKVFQALTYDPVEDWDKAANPLVRSVTFAGRSGVFGYVVEVAPSGFGGEIVMMVGIFMNGESVTGVEIISMSETSGLGARASEPEWLAQFEGKSGGLAVSKDGGEIDALTGATITSRAVTEGVNAALSVVEGLK